MDHISGAGSSSASSWTIETLRESLLAEISHIKELQLTKFDERDKALELQLVEYLRRLDDLNHAHQQSKDKERDFIGREAFETFVTRTGDDFTTLRSEIRATADAISATKTSAAEALALALFEQNKTNESRFGKVENVQSKMVGGLVFATFIAPILSGVLVYVLTK